MIELLVTITVMGIAVVAVLGGITTSIHLSDVHRKQAAAGAYVRTYAEALETAVAASPSAYTPCATTATYSGVYSISGPYTADITAVRYWNGTSFASTCGADGGVQRVSLRVQSSDHQVTETLDVIIRLPCRPIGDFPLDQPCS